MLIRSGKYFTIGLGMFVIFGIVLTLMSLPIFEGKNSFESADNLFNSIAKGSSYRIPQLEKQAEHFDGTRIDCTIGSGDLFRLDLTERLIVSAGAEISPQEGRFLIKGDLGRIAAAALKDAEIMYFDREKEISAKYGHSGKEVLFSWWNILKQIKEALKRQKKVDQATFLDEVIKKGIEVGYNFYGIAPERVSSKTATLAFSLIFYVCYTVWWGFSIFYLFEGFGLAMEAGKKEEM